MTGIGGNGFPIKSRGRLRTDVAPSLPGSSTLIQSWPLIINGQRL